MTVIYARRQLTQADTDSRERRAQADQDRADRIALAARDRSDRNLDSLDSALFNKLLPTIDPLRRAYGQMIATHVQAKAALSPYPPFRAPSTVIDGLQENCFEHRAELAERYGPAIAAAQELARASIRLEEGTPPALAAVFDELNALSPGRFPPHVGALDPTEPVPYASWDITERLQSPRLGEGAFRDPRSGEP